VWTSLTGIVLLDPANAVLIHFLGFLGQHGVLQVGSIEAHGEPAMRKCVAFLNKKTPRNRQAENNEEKNVLVLGVEVNGRRGTPTPEAWSSAAG